MNECEFDDVYSSKKWVIGEYDCRFAICLRTYTDDFLRFWNMWNQKLDDPLDDPDKDAFFRLFNSKKVDKEFKVLYGELDIGGILLQLQTH